MEPGILSKVINDFYTTSDGELSLSKGEYFLVHNVIDKHWCYGVSRDRSGNFPCNHLHKVDLPSFSNTERLYVSFAPFRGEQQGDLVFREGELIIGTHEVEPGWYSGYIEARRGVFPLTHVWLVDPLILKKPADKKFVCKKARVKATLKAQLEEELDLNEGDIVTVTEVLEDGWVRGITNDNRIGTFPEGFITYIESTMDQPDEASADPIPQTVLKGGKIFKDFGQSSSSSNYYDEPAPSYFDLFPEIKATDTAQSFSLDEACGQLGPYSLQTTATVSDHPDALGVHPYAITLYPFNAQFPNELNFEAGEVVHILRHIDTEWVEGTKDNVKGIFPTSYVNIIVDCPTTTAPEPPKDNEESFGILSPGDAVKVEYTFNAQVNGDLSVKEGDSVTVLQLANDDWVSVKNSSGDVGLCPRGYLSKEISEASAESNDIDDFVVIRHQERSEALEEQNIRRKSEPHRPAPPAPAPGSVPLQKQLASEKPLSYQESTEELIEINEPLDSQQKRAEKRQNVISELVITEKEYVRDLKLTYEIFSLYNPSRLESRGVDVTTLFGNILDVIHVAEELLDSILRSMKGKDEDLQTIAPCFIRMAERLQIIYGKYCGNHEAALSLLKKYEENKEIMAVFDKGIETLKMQVICFDMSSILIKPVQRILKYPLMLYELVKCTEDGHPDKEGIENAWKLMTAVASHINEYKRRKDIVSKYLDTDNTLMGKMAKLSMHSVAKKSSRLSAKLSASLGITNIATDSAFDELERQFKSLEKCTFQLANDVEQCMFYLNEETVCGELLSDYINQYHYGSNDNEIRRLSDARRIISTHFIKNLRETIEIRVNDPISVLMTLLQGPAVLITKRRDKLLDYDNAISKAEKNRESKIVQEELAEAKNNYEALNHQLSVELPIFINAGTDILANCIEAFASARKLFCGKIMKKYLMLSESATQVTAQDILQSFMINHNLLWNQISRFSFAGINPKVEEAKIEICTQSEKDRRILMNKYQRSNLFTVKDDIVSTSSLDLGVSKGTIVAAIKRQDPMGDCSRWFVDNGSVKGFIQSSALEPILQPRQQQNNNDSPDGAVGDLMSLESPVKEVKENLINLESPVKQPQMYGNIDAIIAANVGGNSRSSIASNVGANSGDNSRSYLKGSIGDDNDNQSVDGRYANCENEFYYAKYNFDGGIPGTLPARKGRILKLIRPHDDKKNSDWWLMEDRDGNSGYVPQNYINALAGHTSWRN